MKCCPHCGSARFSVVTDATLRFSITDNGATENVRVLDFGSGLNQYVPWCENGHAVERKEMVSTLPTAERTVS